MNSSLTIQGRNKNYLFRKVVEQLIVSYNENVSTLLLSESHGSKEFVSKGPMAFKILATK